MIKLHHFSTNSKLQFDTISLSTITTKTNSIRTTEASIITNDTKQRSQYSTYNFINSKHLTQEKTAKTITTYEKEEEEKKEIRREKSIVLGKEIQSMNVISLNRSKSVIEFNNINSQTEDRKNSSIKRQLKTYRQKQIIEWAKKKPLSNQELDTLIEPPKKEPKEQIVEVKTNDDYIEVPRQTGIYHKSDVAKNIQVKMFEHELIDLSRNRLKTLDTVNYQKRLFIERQLRKAKSLPGLLRCTALQKLTQENDNKTYHNKVVDEFNSSRGNSSRNDVTSDVKSNSIKKSSTIHGLEDVNNKHQHQTQKQSFFLHKPEVSQPAKNKTLSLFLQFSQSEQAIIKSPKYSRHKIIKGSSFKDSIPKKSEDRPQFMVKTEEPIGASSMAPLNDNRFQDLMNAVKKSYFLTNMKDVNKIINKNDALKSSLISGNSNSDIFQEQQKNTSKEIGSKLALKVRKLLDSAW